MAVQEVECWLFPLCIIHLSFIHGWIFVIIRLKNPAAVVKIHMFARKKWSTVYFLANLGL